MKQRTRLIWRAVEIDIVGYEDLVKAGDIDPAQVVRSALQNASSIASLLLTPEALICDMAEEKKEAAIVRWTWSHCLERGSRQRWGRCMFPLA
jgi:hypothetical protein